MKNRIIDLPFPTYRAIEDYKEQQWAILVWMFENLMQDSASKTMIETFSEEGIYDQLAYHQNLLLAACSVSSPTLMIDYMYWRYSVVMNRGISPEYFLFENTLWIRALQNYLFEAYSSEFISLYTSFIEKHEEFSDTKKYDSMYLKKEDTVITQLVEALINSDRNAAHDVFASHFYRYQTQGEFFDSIIKPAMIEIGLEWENNRINVAKEHIATSIIEQLWKEFSTQLSTEVKPDSIAFILTPEAQLHKLGSKMVGSFLQQKGWKVIDLELQQDNYKNIFDLICELQPKIIVLSATMAIYIPLLQDFVNILHSKNIFMGKIIAGGQAFYRTAVPIKIQNIDFQGEYLKDMDEYLSQLEE